MNLSTRSAFLISGFTSLLAIGGCGSSLIQQNENKTVVEEVVVNRGPVNLTGAQITATLTGNTLYQPGNFTSGGSVDRVRMFFGNQGNLEGRVESRSGSGFDTGTWKINAQGQLCRSWRKWRNRREGCYNVTKFDKQVTLNDAAGSADTISGTLIAGNQINTSIANLANQGVSQAVTAPVTNTRSLSKIEIETILSGNTVSQRGVAGTEAYESRILFSPDGSMIGKVIRASGQVNDLGRWRVTEAGEWCRTWNTQWDAGKEGCYTVVRTGNTLSMTFVRGVGSNHQFQLLSGNRF